MEASVSRKIILYADDSALLVSGKHMKTIENIFGDNLLSQRLADRQQVVSPPS